MGVEIKVLKCGNCEELKLGVHATALALSVVMGAYNAAAWLLRRQTHLGVNTVLYSALTIWEIQHVKHHWRARRVFQDRRRRFESAVVESGAGVEKPAA
jgi:hypothetical protein